MALFTTLYSGSSGNCALILHEGKYLLIDMGKSCRTYFFQALFGASLWLC